MSLKKTRLAAVRAGAFLLLLLVLLSAPLLGGFRLSNPESLVYYRYAVVAGERVQIVEGTRVTGDVHSNGDLSTASGVQIDGDASAVGKITGPGTVTGTVREGAPPITLPRLATAAELQAMADRTLQGNQTFTDAVIDDVVFVDGQVKIQGSLGGVGTILATGDVTLEPSSAALGEGTRISLVSLGSIDLAQDRAFRGVIYAGQDVQLGRGVQLEGVVLAGRRAHLSGDARLTFVDFDAGPPAITLQSPAHGSFVATATPQITLTFSDDLSGVDPATVVFFLDGQDRTAQATVSATGLSFQPQQPLADGLHAIVVRASDHSGKEAFAEFSFTTDTIAPMLRIAAPGPLVEGDTTPAVVIDFSDATSGVVPATLVVKVDGTAISCVVQDASAVCEPPELAEGSHTVSAEVADRAGNRSTAASAFQLVLVRQPPVLRIVSPSAGLIVGDATPEIVLEYSDPGSGVDLATLSVILDGQDLTVQCDAQPEKATCEVPPLATGLHTVQAAIENRRGLRTERERLFEISLQLAIVIESPAQGELTRESTVDISGTVSPEADAISVNGIEGIVQNGRFTIGDVPLREGGNALTLVARSAGGGVGSTTVTVVRDTTAPRVVIASPRDGLVTTSSQIAVTGEFIDPLSSNADMAPPVVRVNGFEARRELRTFFYDGLLLQPGENRVRVTVTDALGNEGEAEVGVVLVPSPAQQIEMLLGDGQSGRAGERLPDPLVVRLRDTIGAPLPGRRVLFEVTRGGGRLAAGAEEAPQLSILTDEQGRAQVDFYLGRRAGAGNHEVTVSAPGFPGAVVFCASAGTLDPSRIVRAVGDDHTGAMVAAVATPYPKPLLTQVFDAEGNPVAGVPVTYRVVAGGGSLGGSLGASLGVNPEVTEVTNAQGVASATLTLGSEPGINNNLVEASFPGLGELPVLFAVTGVMPGREEDTAVVGLVLDNQDDPVPGVTLSVVGTDLETVSDEQGRFRIAGVPVGFVALHVDGTTTPRPGTWAHLEFHFATIAGADNSIGMPIRLLPIDVEGGKLVGGSEEVVIPMRGVPGASLIVAPSSVRFRDGSRVGLVSFTQVHADKVPMIAPMGSSFTVAFTVQPTGTRFDPPAAVTLPNVGLPPGTEVDLFSFDHDVGEFLSVGTATVTPDGLLLRSNPGLGISKAGWGGAVPPPPPTTDTCHPGSCTICVDGRPVPKCGPCHTCGGSCLTCSGTACSPMTIEKIEATADGKKDKRIQAKDQTIEFQAKMTEGTCDNVHFDWSFDDSGSPDNEAKGTPVAFHAYKKSGKYTVKVTARCGDCTTILSEAEIEVIIIDMEVTSVGFKNDHQITEFANNAKIDQPDGTAPLWKRTGSPDKPVAYTKNTSPTLFAAFTVSPSVSDPIDGVMIRAKSGTTVIGSASGLKIRGTAVDDGSTSDGDVDDIAGGDAVPSSDGVKKLAPSFEWEFSLDGGSTWASAKTSGPHTMYWTESAPLIPPFRDLKDNEYDPLYDKALEMACGYVGGDANIPMKINTGVDGDVSYDSLASMPLGHPLNCYTNPGGCLCAHQANLLRGLMRSVGVDGDIQYVWAGPDATTFALYRTKSQMAAGNLAWIYTFMVKRPAHDSEPQNPHFSYHAVISHGGLLYDPSYGLSYSALTFDETALNAMPQQTSPTFAGSFGEFRSEWVCPH